MRPENFPSLEENKKNICKYFILRVFKSKHNKNDSHYDTENVLENLEKANTTLREVCKRYHRLVKNVRVVADKCLKITEFLIAFQDKIVYISENLDPAAN